MKYTNGSVFSQMRNGKQVWMVEVVIGYNPNGSRRRTRRQVATKSEALRLRAELIGKAYRGELAPKGGEHLDSFALWWLRKIKSKEVRSATAGDYEARYRLHISPVFGKRKISDISSRDVANWIDRLSASGQSDSSINGVRQVLSMVMEGAVEHGQIEKNPVKAVRKIRTPFDHEALTRRIWSEAECILALKLVRGTSVELAVTLALLLGLRKSEVLGLKWSDFNFVEGSLRIGRSKREVRQFDDDGRSHITVELYPPKNASSARKIGVSPSVASALLAHREAQYAAGHYEKDGWVFTHTSGGPLAPSGLSKRYAAFLKDSGLRRIRFHDLRHSAANLAMSGDARLESVSQVLGHSNIHTTKSIYAPFVEALNADYLEAIESRISLTEPLIDWANKTTADWADGGES